MAVLAHAKAFLHQHPIESTLLGGVAIIGLYLALKPAPASADNGEAQLQNAYFQAEGIQAQSNAAVQVAGITTSAQTAQTAIAADVSKSNATTYANEAVTINDSNNNAAVSALPFATENNLIDALMGVSQQTTTTTKSGGGFSIAGLFGVGGSNKSTTAPTAAATSASNYLEELVNGLYASH